MRTIALTTTVQAEVISTFAAPASQIDAVAEEPGWYVVGSFFLPVTATAKLEAIGSVSEEGLVMSVRLFDVEDAAPVDSTTVEISSNETTRATSSAVELTGGRQYQVHAQVIGESGFGNFQTATLI